MAITRRRPASTCEPLFDFNLDTVDIDTRIFVIQNRSCLPKIQISPTTSSAKQKEALIDTPAEPKQIETELTPDPMPAELYLAHHRRMEREEKRMLYQDRLKLFMDANTLTVQRAQLLSPEWRQRLPGIVRIVDIDNDRECLCKRDLAIKDIDSFLERLKWYKKVDVDNLIQNRGVDKAKLAKHLEKKFEHKTKTQGRLKADAALSRKATAADSHHESVLSYIQPCAFGYQMAPIPRRPREFDIPESWKR